MDARLVIESERVARLAEELSALTGKPVESAVAEALEAKLDRERARREQEALSAELLEIGRRCAAKLRPPFHSSDHADLYGPDGLPA